MQNTQSKHPNHRTLAGMSSGQLLNFFVIEKDKLNQ